MEKQLLIDQFIGLQRHLRRVAFVPRCAGTMQLLPNYTDAVHAYNCAMIYLDLCIVNDFRPANEVLIALLTHDNLEAFTGDLLAPVKDAINEKWDETERQVQSHAADLANLPAGSYETFCKLFPRDAQMDVTLTHAQLLLVKSIDMYEYLVRMMEEYECGNHTKQVLNGLRYGTKTLTARLAKLTAFKEKHTFFDKIIYDSIILGEFMHIAYQALITEHELREVIA